MEPMDKKQIWDKIKERKYDIPFKEEIFSMIEENLNRVEFVKDHIGLRDFLFISEEGTEGFFTSNLFAAMNVDAEKNFPLEQNEKAFSQNYNDDPNDILKDLKWFFVNTERTLFLGIGFIETTSPELRKEKFQHFGPDGQLHEITKYDLVIYEMMQSGKATTYAEASKQLRVFPDWYDKYCKMPDEVKQLTKTEEKEIAKTQFQNKKKYLMELIDQTLDEGNREEFDRLSIMYKELLEKKHS